MGHTLWGSFSLKRDLLKIHWRVRPLERKSVREAMSSRNVIDFLNMVAARADLLDTLKTRSKAEVIASAAAFGLPFSEQEFDPLIWGLEERLANKRGEPFDAQFSLWQTMWGQYYLEYLVLDVMPSFEEADFAAIEKAVEKNIEKERR
jgi:hypothetical protein